MPESVRKPQTLYDKVLSKHIVDEKLDGTLLLYIGTSHLPLALCPTATGPDVSAPPFCGCPS